MERGTAPGAKAGEAERFGLFRPDPAMRAFLYVISLGILFVSVLPWSIPLALLSRHPAAFWLGGVGAHAALLGVLGWLLYWVPKYYGGIEYGFDARWLWSKGGVVWQKHTRLPVGRVQMVEAVQGPWQRRRGVSTLRVHTAAMGEPSAELVYLNVAHAGAIRERLERIVADARAEESGLDERVSCAGGKVTVRGMPHEDLTGIARSLLEEVRSLRGMLEKRAGG